MWRRIAPLAVLIAFAAAPAMATEMGTYQGAGCPGRDKVAAFEKWAGRKIDRGLDFFSFNSWTDIMNESQWSMGCWKKTGLPMTFSVPMLPNDKQSTLAAGAHGDYDHYFQQLGENIVRNGFANAILRLGWEFNGGWYPWAAKKDPDSWVAYWRRIVTVMRAVPGQHFRFDWNPTIAWQQIPQDKVYPGDEYVDIIGMDVYNQTWDPKATTPELRWKGMVSNSYGLDWLEKFAAEHHKPISIPEWGTGTRPDGHGGGDDPLFVTNMSRWIKTHNVVYHNYWDYHAGDYNAKLSDGQFPQSGKAFLEEFRPH